MVIFLRVMCASCVCVAGPVGRARLAHGHEKAPRRTEGQGKALKAPDALQSMLPSRSSGRSKRLGFDRLAKRSLPQPGVSGKKSIAREPDMVKKHAGHEERRMEQSTPVRLNLVLQTLQPPLNAAGRYVFATVLT
jgi:hypothetical protein